MMSRVWKRTRIELVEPASGMQPGQQLLAVNGYPAFLGGRLVGEHEDQYLDLVSTPGALG